MTREDLRGLMAERGITGIQIATASGYSQSAVYACLNGKYKVPLRIIEATLELASCEKRNTPRRQRAPKGAPIGHKFQLGTGYIMVKVGKGHHLANRYGYASEHRVVAEDKLGRRLSEQEEVHHVNGDKADNRPENIEVFGTTHAHKYAHSPNPDRRAPGQANELAPCACGCGQLRPMFDSQGKRTKFIFGHMPQESRNRVGAGRRAYALVNSACWSDADREEFRAKLSAAGMTMTDMAKATGMSIAGISRVASGSRQPSKKLLAKLDAAFAARKEPNHERWQAARRGAVTPADGGTQGELPGLV